LKVLKLWVGHDYVTRSALFLQILVLGNAIRQLGYPYATVAVATGKQQLATIVGFAEAIVNQA
jgi:O-antigen/teichoic acid export membrane protein